jgi:guanine deaminase
MPVPQQPSPPQPSPQQSASPQSIHPHPAFMRRAIALATENVRAGRGGPFGTVIVRDGEILSEAANSVTADNDPTAHAEIVAIRRACRKLSAYRLTGCDLYTSCEPCPMCLAAIYWARIDRIYYGNTAEDAARIGFDDEFLYREHALPRDRRSIPTTELLRSEASESFHAWSTSPVKVPY